MHALKLCFSHSLDSDIQSLFFFFFNSWKERSSGSTFMICTHWNAFFITIIGDISYTQPHQHVPTSLFLWSEEEWGSLEYKTHQSLCFHVRKESFIITCKEGIGSILIIILIKKKPPLQYLTPEGGQQSLFVREEGTWYLDLVCLVSKVTLIENPTLANR